MAKEEVTEERVIRNDIIAVALLAVIVFTVASLFTYSPSDPASSAPALLTKIYQPDQLVYPPSTEFNNACGSVGAWTADMLIHVLGFGAYYLIFGMISLEMALFRRQSVNAPWLKTIGWILSLIGLTAMSAVLLPNWTISPLIGAGGYLGALCKGLLALNFGISGTVITATCVTLIGLMMWTEYLVFRTGRIMFAPALVAGAKLLPFGLTHRFMTWVNGDIVDELDEDEEYEYEDEEEEEEDPETRIRFKSDAAIEEEQRIAALAERDDANLEYEEEDEDVEASDEADDEYEYEEEEEELEGEEEEVEEAPAVKAPVDPEPEPVAVVAPKPHFKMPQNKPAPKSDREIVMSQLNAAAKAEASADYDLPSLAMLKSGSNVSFEQQKREALEKAKVLEKTCKEFGYKVKVVEIETGPVISQYEIDLEPGLRLQKIVALADDLAIAMRVPSVRIVAPIPGKNSVGVEVPNQTRQMVRLRDVMKSSESQINKMKIPLFLGKDAVGAPMVADLAKLPHLLIAGRTGTGKSVCLNAIIASILMTRKPDEVRMLMIDPKMVELSGYARLPHLMHPVVTDMKKAEAILAWAVDKMEERYTLLAKVGVRHVTTYNQLGKEELHDRLQPDNEAEEAAIPATMPFIVIVADEMADLMMTAGKDVEAHIIRLAQKSRAVGIHLILATQKPTVDVITGLIKSNLPARIAFQVASKMDSRVVLDVGGADKLLGLGDMLFLWPGTSTLLRGQGTFLEDEEIDLITDTVSTGEQNFVHELVNIKVKSEGDDDSESAGEFNNRDEKYAAAIDVVVREQRGSCSLLQRAMRIGYGRAARLIDFMSEDGYVGPYNGSKHREVLLSHEQWELMKAGGSKPTETIEAQAVAAPAVPPKPAPKPTPKPTVPKPKMSVAKKPIKAGPSKAKLLAQKTTEPLDEAPLARNPKIQFSQEPDEVEEVEDEDEEDLAISLKPLTNLVSPGSITQLAANSVVVPAPSVDEDEDEEEYEDEDDEEEVEASDEDGEEYEDVEDEEEDEEDEYKDVEMSADDDEYEDVEDSDDEYEDVEYEDEDVEDEDEEYEYVDEDEDEDDEE